jgi:hypothetical protein
VTGVATMGDVDVATLDASGNVNIVGTLDVTGQTTLGALDAGAADLASLQVSGTSSFSGVMTAGDIDASTLDVSGAATIGSTLAVTGLATMAGINATDIDAASLDLSGNADIQGTLNVAAGSSLQNLSVSGTLGVTGTSSFTGDMVAGNIDASTLDASGAVTVGGAFDATGNATFAGNVDIAGNLSVQGTTVYRNSEDVLLADRFIAQNYTLTLPATGQVTAGNVYVAEALGSQFTILSVNAAAKKFYVSADPASVIAIDDVIAVAGLSEAKNLGIFQVAARGQDGTGYYVEVHSPDAGGPLDAICQTVALVNEASAPANSYLAHVAIQVFRSDGDGVFQLGYGNSESSMVYDEITPATAITLQQAYDNGATITTASGQNVVIAGTEALEITAAGGIESNTLDLSSTLDVAGTATFTGAITQTGASPVSFAGAVSASDTLTVTSTLFGSAAQFSGNVDMADLDAANGDFSGTLAVTGATTLSSFTASANSQVNADLAVSGAFSAGASTLASASISGALSGNTASFSGLLQGVGAEFSADIEAVNADFSGNITAVDGSFSGNVSISGNLTLTGDLELDDLIADQAEVNTLGAEYTAGEALLAGHIVAINGGTKQVVKALADDAVAAPLRRAWAVSRDAVSSAAMGFMAIAGSVSVKFESAATGSAGAPVFLSATTAGCATLVAPSAAGNAVMQIGYLAEDVSAATSGLVAIEKQFIAQIPA